jgi:hypothetical protein
LNKPGLYDITGGLTGSDPEDGLLGAGKTYKITRLPVGALLYYNGILVTLNQVISAFDPTLLKIDPDDATYTTTFDFASMDAAGLYDPTPATITVNWTSILPIMLLDFTAKLNGTRVDLNWKTSSESNSDHFEVERSTDASNYIMIARVLAKGYSSVISNYAAVDPIPVKGINYYRLKMVDKDAQFVYSKIVPIRIDNPVAVATQVRPNPFTGNVDVYITLTHNSPVDFNFLDISGKSVYRKTVKGLKGFNWFTINDLEKLPAAPYILSISTDTETIVQKLIKQ